jgi:hypothetical protein
VTRLNEFSVKYDLSLKKSLNEKLEKEFRSTLKVEKGTLKGYTWPQQ